MFKEVVGMRLGILRRGLPLLAVATTGGLLLAACGGGASAPSSKGGGSQGVAISTDQVAGVGTVLDTSKGLTLYYNTEETGGKIVCTGSCATVWPPVVVDGDLPNSPAGVDGAFATVTRPDGTTQLTFDGRPLYTYAGDTGPGQASGQGIQGVWFAQTATRGKATPSGGGGSGSSRGGYG